MRTRAHSDGRRDDMTTALPLSLLLALSALLLMAGLPLSASAACVAPVGFACPNPSLPPTACAPGTFANVTGALFCAPCPPGSQCAEPALTPVPCSAGSYSLTGAVTCTLCEENYACPNTFARPVQCPTGYTAAAGATECTVCAAGQSCAAGNSTACLAGQFSPEGADLCTQCPAGFACPDPALAPIPCVVGTFAVAGQTHCAACPAGHRCPYPDQNVQLVCVPGTFSAINASSCTSCPAGFKCPEPTSSTPVACDEGTYAVTGSAVCTDCPAGMRCPDRTGANMETCAPGSYALIGATECTPCPAGKSCNNTDTDAMTPCDAGWFSVKGSAVCTICPAGSKCPSTEFPPGLTDMCGPGTYSVEGEIECHVCPIGMACPFNSVAPTVACPAGTYAPGSSASCAPCLSGHFCPNSTVQIQCPSATYAPAGSSECRVCPAGHSCLSGTAVPQKCFPGNWAPAGASGCSSCAEGYYCPVAGMSMGNETTFICPPGHWCGTGSAAPTMCDAGTYRLTSGATLETQCLPCLPGYFCAEKTSNYILNVCPMGYWCDEGTTAVGNAPPLDHRCPSGTWNPKLGATNHTACLRCSKGNWCPPGASVEQVCPPGYFCPEGTQSMCAAGATSCDTSPPRPCPAGTFSPVAGLIESPQCQNCPSGSYCPAASIYPTACPAGTFNPTGQAGSVGACVDCTAGSACPVAGLRAPGTNCSTGHYCPAGTVFPSDTPCELGKYTDSVSATQATDCKDCPAGFTCGYGTGGTQNPPVPCVQGYYCPEGYSAGEACPAGTWSAAKRNTKEDDCLPCPAGSFCNAAATSVTSPCSFGHYCPPRTGPLTQQSCPPGTHGPSQGLERVDQCTICPAGHWCPGGQKDANICGAGSYNPYTHQSGAAACLQCPGGSTCPSAGLAAPVACGTGHYSNVGSNATTCPVCVAGSYCPSNTTSQTNMTSVYLCPAGTFCDTTVAESPLNDVNRLCPKGRYCPQGTSTATQKLCPSGTYNPVRGLNSSTMCLPCPPGKYCATNGLEEPTGDCDAGYYCTGGSSTQTQYACPVGTYRSRPGGSSVNSCAWCPGGYICATPHLVNPVICPQGSYCTPNSTVAQGCPAGTYGGSQGLQFATLCTPCDAGHFCSTIGLTKPTGPCREGYYCLTGAANDMAAGQPAVGGPCPIGGYCPTNSTKATPCPAGTYGNGTGFTNPSQCTNCPAGFFCQGSGLSDVTGPCAPGHFCVEKSESSKPSLGVCPVGNYCPGGTGAAKPCEAGYFQGQTGASKCDLCDAGYFCPSTAQTNSSAVSCPKGSFCVAGSSAPASCPPGTIGEALNLKSVAECTPCPLGYWCAGGDTPKEPCVAGIYCPGNITNANGVACPMGSYCEAKSTAPEPCGVGFFQPNTLATNKSACILCTAGSVCSNPTGSAVSGQCAAGSYCPAGSIDSGLTCPINTFCTAGKAAPESCAPGTFNNGTGASACKTCVAGFYCPGATSIDRCPAGHWCAAGANSTNTPGVSGTCPRGTYGQAGLSAESQCTPCPAGFYCALAGQAEVTGPCGAGYQCLSGAINAQGSTLALPATTRPCPAGYYCPSGGSATACPVGTYMPYNVTTVGAGYVTNCTQCPPTYYCDQPGMTSVAGRLCAAGYYCGGNSSSPTPSQTDAFYDARNGKCEAGFYCPLGSAAQIPCPNGTYSSTYGASFCTPCSAGYFCPLGSSDPEANKCPAGSFCVGAVGSPTLCPAGTYSSATGLASLTECTKCDAGRYCASAGLTQPTGNCSAGYLCRLASTSAAPTDGVLGLRCSPGTYCPEGATHEFTCPINYYCSGGLGAPDGLCGAGAYCLMGESSRFARACPKGSYCNGTGLGVQPCPVGTASAVVNATTPETCQPCLAGFYCNGTGMVPSDALACPPKYFCPSGTIVPDASPAGLCPVGYHCPGGNFEPSPCGPGFYQQNMGQTVCNTVPAGFYSDVTGPAGNPSVVTCPPGSYCPEGTNSPTQFLCPPGTFFGGTGARSVDSCVPCTAGFYCGEPGMTAGNTKPCAAGYYCREGSNTSQPTNGVMGNICPYGAYCEKGSADPVPCPAGLLAPYQGSTNLTACQACPPGQYCSSSLIVGGAIPLCSAGYWCKGGAIVANPNDGATGEACAPGTFCVAGTAAPPPLCPAGSYNPNYAQGSCTPCPAGRLCAGEGMTAYDACPPGYYCAGSNSQPTPCPAGRFSTALNLTAPEQCSACPAGQFCSGAFPTTNSTGPCSAGFICLSGASSPAPSGTYPAPGKCPAGHYCPSGVNTPTPCPQGSFNPSTGAQNVSACSPCTAGRYCATQGLAAVTGPCDPGNWCPLGSSVPNPVQCPPGHYCPGGDAAPIACPSAFYNSQWGRTTCLPCEAGWTCANGSTTATEQPCPLGFFCPTGTPPISCPAGSYGHRINLQSAAECASCPPGLYCSSGLVTGNCTAGYLCKAGNLVQNPPGPLDPPGGSTVNGGPCPPGFYCPPGTLTAIACPAGTSRIASGGSQAADCGPCIAGYQCLSNVPFLCPQGFYCPLNNTAAIACPPGSYGPKQGGFNQTSCLPCAAGYTCPQFNMSDYAHSPCVPGHFCPVGSVAPLPCPAGSYRATPRGQSSGDCAPCPEGSWCPEASVTHIRCLAGSFCPESSSLPTPCPPGYYCAADASDPSSTEPVVPVICPAGFYCPENSTSYHVCDAPFYCPLGSSVPQRCPRGSYNVTTNDRTSAESSCGFCPPGTFSVDPDNPVCEPCTPGYVCLTGTNTATPKNVSTDFGFQCEPGQYCPLGSTFVQYCPPGTYNPSVAGTGLESCLPCRNNSFSSVVGATTCTPCGSSAYASEGATTCACNGTYRAYQMSDGTCKCKPGYEFYDHSNQLFDGDSPLSCTPIVYSECKGRNRNSQGSCVSDKEEACQSACAGSALRLANAQCDPSLLQLPDGVLDVVTQVCTCANVPIIAYCDEACRANNTVITLTRGGTIGVVNRGAGLGATLSKQQLVDSYGLFAPQLACNRDNGCQVSSIVTSAAGHRALFDVPPSMAALAGLPVTTVTGLCNYSAQAGSSLSFSTQSFRDYEEPVQREHFSLLSLGGGVFSSLASPQAGGGGGDIGGVGGGRLYRAGSTAPISVQRRNLAGGTSNSNPYLVSPTIDYLQTLRGYYNPTLCLQLGESVFWQIDDPAHYPVYDKDNFLNSNPDFDFGVFEQLASQLRVGAPVTTFAFTFFTMGVYVFADAANDEHLTIIAVLDQNHPCPAGNRVLPTSAASLKPLGVGTAISPMTEPDLTLIWALLGMFLGLVVVIAVVAKLKQKRAVRALALAADDDSVARNDFKNLYLELREMKKVHKGMFNKQRDHFRSECDRICAETEQVKALLATKMTDGRGFVDAAINLLLQELTARGSYGNRQARRETEMFAALSTLQRMLDDAVAMAERPLSIPTEQIQEQVDLVGGLVAGVIREAEKERTRKRHVTGNAGIIGDEIVAKLTERAFGEENKENAFLAKLKVFRGQCGEYRGGVAELLSELQEKVRVLQERRNLPAVESAQLKVQRRVSDMVSELSIDLERLLGTLPGVHDELKLARDDTAEDENEALEVLEQRKLDVEAQAQTGIFRDLDEDLAEAIKFFLLQARRELLPMQPAFDQAQNMAGGMMIGRGFGQAEFTTGGGGGGGAGGAAGGAGGRRGEGQPGDEDADADVDPSDMVEATSAELTAAADEEAERQRKVALENAEEMSVDELRQLYADLRQREELMSQLQRAEEERQKKLAEELLKSAAIEPEDEMLLHQAKELLDSLVEVHRREEEELHSKIKSDEEVRISAEIAALSKVEESVERKKKELAEEMARRNELAASESEKTEIAHEHQVQLKSLEESLRADKINSQKALSKIHEDMRSKLRAAKKDMKAKQRAAESEVRADFEKVKTEVERKIEEKSVKIEGVDLGAIERQLHASSAGAPSAKQQALHNFHLQTQQDMAKKQQSDERKLAEESEKERQKELDLLDKQFDARKESEMAELESRLKAERDSLGDEEQAKALMLQHQNQLRALGAEIDNEKARQRAHLNAALAKKRKAKEAKLRAEHALELEKELLEQKKEMGNIEKAGMKKKEIDALALILTRENHKKAKAIIEKIIKPRQHKEMSALIQDNFKESAMCLSENLEKSMEAAQVHREDIDRRLHAKEITYEDAEREHRLVEREVDPDAIKRSTLQYLEPQQNEKLTLQKRSHFQEVKDLMKKFYPQEDFSGVEWNMEEQVVNVAALLREGEERKRKQEEAYAAQLKELEAREAEQLRELEELKAKRMAELEAKMNEENDRLQAEFEAQLAARKRDFEEQQKQEQERALAVEMETIKARELDAQVREAAMAERLAAAAAAGGAEGEVAVAAAAAAATAEATALAAEKAAIAEEKSDVLADLAEAQRETQRQQELESERQRKKFANKLALKAQQDKLSELAKLEEEHAKSMEQQKKNLAASAEKLKMLSVEEEVKKQEAIALAARAFVRFGRAYADHREIGVKHAVRRIRKVYDKARAAGRIGFGLVPGPVAGTMLQVPLQPGMAIIGGGGAVAGEGGAGMGGGGVGGVGGGMVGAGGALNVNGMSFPGTGESGQPFFNKLEQIEFTLTRLLKTGNDGLYPPNLLGYTAPGEEALVCEGARLSEMSLLDLSPKKFVLYRFGLFILDFLAEAHAVPSLRLLFTRGLPAKADAHRFAENPFKNSFHFDPVQRVIYVRVERTEEVGEFTLLLVHVVSHILAQQWSDAHPKFQEFFHRSLQFICSELFFARTKKGYAGFGAGASNASMLANKKHAAMLLQPGEASSSSSSSATAAPVDDALLPSEGISYKELQSLFGLVNKLEFREDLVGEFIDLHLGAQGDETFGEELLLARLEQYKLFNYSAPLNTYLRDLERAALTGKQEANLQARTNAAKDKNMAKMGAGGDKEERQAAAAAAAAAKAKRSSTGAPVAASSSMAKESLSARDKLKAAIERLLEESDQLHSQLLGVIGAMSPVSESLLALQELQSKLAHAKVPKDSPQVLEAALDRKKVQAKLKRLNIQKDALQQRIENVEEKYKVKMAELGQTK